MLTKYVEIINTFFCIVLFFPLKKKPSVLCVNALIYIYDVLIKKRVHCGICFMDLKLIYQPKHHFRFFDLIGEPKEIFQSINDDYQQVSLVTLEEAIEPLLDFIPEVKDMIKLVKDKCQQMKTNLSIDELASIMLYTLEWLPKENSFYYIFNRKLQSSNQNELISCYSYLKLLSTSLSKLSKLSNRIFYRAIQLDLKPQYSLDKIFIWNEYISCTASIDIFDKDKVCFNDTINRTLLIIHSTHGLDISECSFYGLKHEILLPPGKPFLVVSHRESNNGLSIITLKEFPISFPSKMILNHDEQNSFELLFRKRMKKYEKYSEINLRNANLTDYHLNIIIKYAIKKKRCSWLSLQNNQITSYGFYILSKELKENESLETLILSKNYIDDTGLEYLKNIFSQRSYSNLTFLSLDYNSIQDQGVKYLADMLKINKTLTDLWLSYNQISNQGVESLTDVLTHDNHVLMQLYLHGNQLINDMSIKYIERMFKFNKGLDTLWLNDCSFTQEGKERLETKIQYRQNFYLNV